NRWRTAGHAAMDARRPAVVFLCHESRNVPCQPLVLLSAPMAGGRVAFELNSPKFPSSDPNRHLAAGCLSPAAAPRRLAMHTLTDDLRIQEIRELHPPEQVMREYLRGERASRVVATARKAVQDMLHGRDDRLLVVIGPCSIHDV